MIEYPPGTRSTLLHLYALNMINIPENNSENKHYFNFCDRSQLNTDWVRQTSGSMLGLSYISHSEGVKLMYVNIDMEKFS